MCKVDFRLQPKYSTYKASETGLNGLLSDKFGLLSLVSLLLFVIVKYLFNKISFGTIQEAF